MSAAKLTVHTLTIDHRHGMNTSLFTTAEAAHRAIDEWLDLYWHAEVPSTTERPEVREEAWEAYFEAAGESYTLDTAELEVDLAALAIPDADQVRDLIASKIELLAEYKLEYPQDYEEADIDAMKAEIMRLESLLDRLPNPAAN